MSTVLNLQAMTENRREGVDPAISINSFVFCGSSASIAVCFQPQN